MTKRTSLPRFFLVGDYPLIASSPMFNNVRISTMTLVLGMVGSDGIVLSADGRATFTDNRPPINNYRKIYPLGTLYVGFAARGLSMLDDTLFLNECRVIIQRNSKTFSVAEYTLAMSQLARMFFSGRDNFEIGFIVTGYDRDENDRPTVARLYRFMSSNEFIVEDCPADERPILLTGSILETDVPSPKSNNTIHLKNFFEGLIRKNESVEVGGDIMTVIMKGDDVQETLQKTD